MFALVKNLLTLFVIYGLTINISQADCIAHDAAFTLENDSALTLGGGTDRFYSNGFEGAYRCKRAVKNNAAKNIAHKTLSRFHPEQIAIEDNIGFRFGQKIYTNSDITLEDFEINTRDDRPYAAWLYASVFFESQTSAEAYLRHEFSLGCVGTCAQGEEVQREWHELFGLPEPRGWDLQIENQLAAQYYIEYLPRRYQVMPYISLHPRYEASIGTILTDFSLGGDFIIGDQSDRNILSQRWRWQFFLHNEIKLVAYNSTLQGSLFNDNSPHVVDPSRFLIENGIGVRLDYNQLSFQYRFIGRSTELEEQGWKFWDHKYGSFNIGFGF